MVSTMLKRCAVFAALAILVMTAVAYAADITTKADLTKVENTAQATYYTSQYQPRSGQRVLGDYTPQMPQRHGKYYFAPTTIGDRLKAFYIGDMADRESALTQYGVSALGPASPRSARVAVTRGSPSSAQASMLNLPLDKVQQRQDLADNFFDEDKSSVTESPSAHRVIGSYGKQGVVRRGRYYFTRFDNLRMTGTVYIGQEVEPQHIAKATKYMNRYTGRFQGVVHETGVDS